MTKRRRRHFNKPVNSVQVSEMLEVLAGAPRQKTYLYNKNRPYYKRFERQPSRQIPRYDHYALPRPDFANKKFTLSLHQTKKGQALPLVEELHPFLRWINRQIVKEDEAVALTNLRPSLSDYLINQPILPS